jgi:sec-independent protein translocase protein TatA
LAYQLDGTTNEKKRKNFMHMPGPFELLVIFLVILLLFGGKKLPEFGKALGQGIREFKKALKSIGEDDEQKKEAKPKD